ncbi:thermonuclease family protein [Staphylococcus condimenti]|uniref:thermonuclease NucI n=1 Tax=Staphylococcus TaxID=1279 RepID=UPI00159F62D1|nr:MULTISPECIES: thermonuclease family protein [Staphylococcus]MDK8644157.1 thermonuclease family protein [Staphylococcus condimenti]
MVKQKSLSTILTVVVIALVVLGFQYFNHSGPFKNSSSHISGGSMGDKEEVQVKRFIDGDTFIATDKDGKEIKVRMIGMDTPETVKPNTPVQPYGKEASNYSKKTLNHKTVYLEYDKEKQDQYGRNLSYVWLDKDHMYNKELVEKGLAREKYFAPNGKYREVFKEAQKQAQDENLNIWSRSN